MKQALLLWQPHRPDLLPPRSPFVLQLKRGQLAGCNQRQTKRPQPSSKNSFSSIFSILFLGTKSLREPAAGRSKSDDNLADRPVDFHETVSCGYIVEVECPDPQGRNSAARSFLREPFEGRVGDRQRRRSKQADRKEIEPRGAWQVLHQVEL